MKRIKKILGGLVVLAVGGYLVFLGVGEYRTSKRLVREGTSINAQVTDKDISYGRKNRKSYYLEVSFKTASGEDYENRVRVSSAQFDAAKVGGTVPVRYLPSDPETCQVGDKASVPWLYWVGGAFLALCGVGSCASAAGSNEESAESTADSSDTNQLAANETDTADDDEDDEELAA